MHIIVMSLTLIFYVKLRASLSVARLGSPPASLHICLSGLMDAESMQCHHTHYWFIPAGRTTPDQMDDIPLDHIASHHCIDQMDDIPLDHIASLCII